MFQIHINEKFCKKCGYCIAFCPKEVFRAARDGGPVVHDPEQCSQCEQCDLRCPDFAITLQEVENG